MDQVSDISLFTDHIPALPEGVIPASREGILAMQDALTQVTTLGRHEELFPLTHWFGDGIYTRQIFLPAGTIIIGEIHKHAHVNILIQGRCSVLTEDGVAELVAPLTFLSKPGTKRVVFTHEDAIWTTIHRTDQTDPEMAVAELTCKDFAEYDALLQLENKS